MIKDRLIWSFFGRYRLRRSVQAFRATLFSYVNKNVSFEGYNSVYDHAVIRDASIGLFTYVAEHARVVNCKVGRYCCIGQAAFVGGLGVHPSKRISSHPVFYSLYKQAGETTFAETNSFEELPVTTIGNDVWIGARAIVLDGLNVGDGAIIAAGAVVVKDVEPYSIVGGVPAKKIRSRFEDAVVSDLLRLKWWDWPVDKLKKMAPFFRADDVMAINQLITQKNDSED